jgi:hypothetical protein
METKTYLNLNEEEQALSKPLSDKLLELYKLKTLTVQIITPSMEVKIAVSEDTEEEKLLKKQIGDLWKKYYKNPIYIKR